MDQRIAACILAILTEAKVRETRDAIEASLLNAVASASRRRSSSLLATWALERSNGIREIFTLQIQVGEGGSQDNTSMWLSPSSCAGDLDFVLRAAELLVRLARVGTQIQRVMDTKARTFSLTNHPPCECYIVAGKPFHREACRLSEGHLHGKTNGR